MDTFELIVTVVLMVAYTAFSVWAVTKFKKLSAGIAGSVCLAAGGIGIYLSGVFIAAAILWLLEVLFAIGVFVLVISILGS